jgi:periplasmic divalent cation tolerance protein
MDPSRSEALIVLTTFGDREKAVAVAHTLVEEQLAACVNLLGEVRSIYRWKGEISDDPEVLCLVKTTRAGFEKLRTRLVELHPYEVPELLAVPVESAHPPYLEWLLGSVAG